MATYRYAKLNGGGIMVQKRFLYFWWRNFYPLNNELHVIQQKLNKTCEELQKLHAQLKDEERRQKKLGEKIDTDGDELKGISKVFRGPGWPVSNKMRKPLAGPQVDMYSQFTRVITKTNIGGAGVTLTTEGAGAVAKAIKPEAFRRGPELIEVFPLPKGGGNNGNNKGNHNGNNQHNNGHYSPVT